MTGLSLIALAAMWVAALRWIVRSGFKFVPDRPWRKAAKVGMFVLLVPLPLIDELIAAPQFRSLCAENSSVIVDMPDAKGRQVWFENSERTELTLGTLRVTQSKRNFTDPKTHEPIYHYYRMEAQGGWLIRTTGQGNAPLIFENTCEPADVSSVRSLIGAVYVDHPIGE